MSSSPPLQSMPSTPASSLNITAFSQNNIPSHFMEGSEFGHNGMIRRKAFILMINKINFCLLESGWSVRNNQSFGPSVQSSFIPSHQVSGHSSYPSDHFSQPMLNILNSNSAGHSNIVNNEFQYNGHNNSENIGSSHWSSASLSSSRNISEGNSWHTPFVAPNPSYQTNSYSIF